MREIKFRAWDKKKKETGLKDKNGKEIYEGDILKHNNLTSEVIFEDGCFKWFCKRINLKGFLGKPIEVIGNIYENENLLKN